MLDFAFQPVIMPTHNHALALVVNEHAKATTTFLHAPPLDRHRVLLCTFAASVLPQRHALAAPLKTQAPPCWLLPAPCRRVPHTPERCLRWGSCQPAREHAQGAQTGITDAVYPVRAHMK